MHKVARDTNNGVNILNNACVDQYREQNFRVNPEELMMLAEK